MGLSPSVLFVLVPLAACTPTGAQQAVYGTGRSKDGDSLMVGDTELRLFEIDLLIEECG